MDRIQTEYFKTILEGQLEGLLNLSGHAISELISQSGREIEYIDFASVDADQAMKIRIRSRESQLIKKIQAALQRIENDTYGICESCGEAISYRRLSARPVTTKCIECKTEEERSELLVQ